MDLSVFFERIPQDVAEELDFLPPGSLGQQINRFGGSFPIWEEADLVLIGGRRSAQSKNTAEADAIRNELYRLSPHQTKQKLADLGNLKLRESEEDYLQSLTYVLRQLVENGKIVILLAGSQIQTLAMAQAYPDHHLPVSYVQIDKKFDLNPPGDIPDSGSYNCLLLEESEEWLYSFSNLGYQRFEVKEAEKEFLSKRHFGSYRLGELSPSPREAEPELRMADMISLDMSAIRFAEAPGATEASPAGFDVNQACTLARYAGMGYRASTFLLSEFEAANDLNRQTSKMAALLAWYFMDGYYNRWEDKPQDDCSNLRKYAVQLNASVEEIPFYKHPVSGRWWMEVIHPESLGKTFSKSMLVPCSEQDYEIAKTDHIPERWWQAFHRMTT